MYADNVRRGMPAPRSETGQCVLVSVIDHRRWSEAAHAGLYEARTPLRAGVRPATVRVSATGTSVRLVGPPARILGPAAPGGSA